MERDVQTLRITIGARVLWINILFYKSKTKNSLELSIKRDNKHQQI